MLQVLPVNNCLVMDSCALAVKEVRDNVLEVVIKERLPTEAADCMLDILKRVAASDCFVDNL